jgi:Tfp pilus assembly protein PilF/DNA-directed RNA polymerase subunit RPC12/RpoP
MEPEGTVTRCANCGKPIFAMLEHGGFGNVSCPYCGTTTMVVQASAIGNLTKAVARDYNNRGNILDSQGRYDEAIENFTRAIELDPTYALAYFNRGNVYARRLQRYDKALADYNQAIEMSPIDAAAYTNRGAVYASLERDDEALEDLERAIQLDPDLAGAYFGIGALLGKRKEWQEALPFFEKASELGYVEAEEFVAMTRGELEKRGGYWLNQTKAMVSFNAFAYAQPEGELSLDEAATFAKSQVDTGFVIDNYSMYEKLVLSESRKNILWIPCHATETRFDIHYITQLIRQCQHKITLAPLENPFRMEATIVDVRRMLNKGSDSYLRQASMNVKAGHMPLISRQGEARHETVEFNAAAQAADLLVFKGLRNFLMFWEASSAMLSVDAFYMFVCHHSSSLFVPPSLKSRAVGIDEGMVLAFVPAFTPIKGTLASFSRSH